MSAQTNRFKRAAKVAKKLYKTGKYQRYSDAMKAAFKKIGNVSNGNGHYKRSAGGGKKKRKPVKKVKRSAPPRERVKNIRRTNSTVTTSEIGSLSSHLQRARVILQTQIGNAHYYVYAAKTKAEKRKAQRRVNELKKQLQKLMK